jgi:predicted transcriptional regulator
MKALTTRVKDETFEKVQKMARELDRSLNWVVEMMIESFFEKEEKGGEDGSIEG